MVKKLDVNSSSSRDEGVRYGTFQRSCLPLAAGALLAFALTPPATAQLPVGPTVVHGNAAIGTSGNQMTVTNSPSAILNWQSFSVGASNGVHFQQQNAASQVLNRVTGNDPSQILGSLSSNGRVWLVNPNGVLFGQNARIDVAGLVASTLNISNADFLANRFNFVAAAGPNRGQVMNQGQIRTTFGGRVLLIGEQVQNEGLIQTPGGEIVLAAGKSVELVDSGMPNVVVRVSAPENQAVNLGTLMATGGSVDLHAGIVNQQGIVHADSVSVDAAGRIALKGSTGVMLSETSQTRAHGGRVELQANTVNNRGEVSGKTVTVTGKDILQQGRISSPGGSIAVSAQNTTYLDGSVDVSNPDGKGGSIRVDTGKLEGMAGGSLRADGAQGGRIRVEGRGTVGFSSTVSATGTARGGDIEITGDQVYVLNARIDASGAQGGRVHLGGGWQGSGDLPHARAVLVGVGTEVKANGTPAAQAAGGEVVVWSKDSSEHYGTLQARDGGRIEFSSKGSIRQTGSIQAGPGGSVLFDPKNLIITDNPPDSLTLARKVVSGGVVSAQPALVDGDFFGVAVALDGDRLAVGAHGDNTGDFQAGAVHLFTGVGTDFSGLTWRKKLASSIGAFGMPTLTVNDFFGTSVALKGDLLAVGTPFDDTGGTDRGAVHLFNGVGADFSGLTWQKKLASQTGAVNMTALANSDDFGRAVALDGDHLAVGASVDDTGGPGRGAVHLFTGVGTDFSGLTWQKKLVSGTGAVNMPVLANVDMFGYSVALDGDRLAVGAIADPALGASGLGSVHLFTGVISTGCCGELPPDFTQLTWQKRLANASGAINMPSLANGDHFGSGVALNGDLLVVGAPFDNTGGTGRGAVYSFEGVGSDFSGLVWQGKIASRQGAAGMLALADGDAFGWSVALDSGRLAVGARLDDDGGVNRGAIHLFTSVATDFATPTWQRKLASGAVTGSMPVLANNDFFGISVALDGDRLAVAADFDNAGGVDRGAVHLFTGVGTDFSGLTWQKRVASGTGAVDMPVLNDSDHFGIAVALDGDRLAVGTDLDDTGGPSRGAVHLFSGVGTDFSGLSWKKKLASGTGATGMPALSNGDQFGLEVALDGDRLAVGAPSDDTSGIDRGAVHLFTGVETDFSGLTWQKKLASSTGATGMLVLNDGDRFGNAFALNGDRLAVGAPNDDTTGGTDLGAVHLFAGVGADFSGLNWQRKLASAVGAIGMPVMAAGDQFGIAVALDGDRLAVGAVGDDTGGNAPGAVHLFTGVGTDSPGLTWRKKLASEIGASGMPALASEDRFGVAIALDGDRLVVGAELDDTGGDARGAVHLFTAVGADFSGLTWQKKLASGIASMPTLSNQDNFGGAVALDGDRLAVGVFGDDTGGADRGAVHLFTGAADFFGLTWQKKVASGTGASGMPSLVDGDQFGRSIALDSGRLAVGAPFDDTGGTTADTNRGAVHLFTGVGTDFSNLAWQTKLASGAGATGMPALANSDQFGKAVALDGDRLVVGAPEDSTGFSNAGAVHLFTGAGTDFSALAWRGKLVSGTDPIPTLSSGHRLGTSLALQGDLLAIGGDLNNGLGKVYLFNGVGTDFTTLQMRTILTSGSGAINMPVLGAGGDAFGEAIALDGDRLAVGARRDDTGGGSPDSDRGAVHLFNGVGTDFSGLTWRRKIASGSGAIGMAALVDGDNFGTSVALDGDRLAVGAPFDNTAGTHRGAVYLFTGMSTLGSVIDVSETTFANNPSGTSFITASAITTLLTSETAVTLQANNDITVDSPIDASGEFILGDFTLRAGRNILINANIIHDGGNFTAVAGDPGANPAFRDPGTTAFPLPTINIANGVVLDIGSGTGTLAAVGGNVLSAGSLNAGTGRWLLYAADPATSVHIPGFSKHYDQTFTLGSTPTYANSGSWLLYSLAPTLSVTPSRHTIIYGDPFPPPAFSSNFAGFIDGDTVATAGLTGTATWNVGGVRSTSGNPIVGSHDVTLVGGLASSLGYRFANNDASPDELTVNAKSLIGGITIANKTYDGTTGATIAGRTLSGVITRDDVSYVGGTDIFSDKNVGTGKTVTITGLSLAGADAGNYTVNSTTTALADITPKPLTPFYTGVDKIYDATTAAQVLVTWPGIISGDSVTLPGTTTGTFDNKNVGTDKPIAVNAPGSVSGSVSGQDAANYDPSAGTLTATADITPKPLTPVYTGVDKIYDATTAAQVLVTWPGIITGDSVTLPGTTTGTFDNKNVGTDKPIAVTPPGSVSGLDAQNYAPSAGTLGASAGITPKPLTPVYTGVDKIYDATTAAQVLVTWPGIITGDSVTLPATTTGTFNNKNVGPDKPIAVSPPPGSASGTDAPNYLPTPGTLSSVGSVTPATLTFVAAPNTREVGGSVAGLTGTLTGFQGGDSLENATTGTLVWTTPATSASPAGTYPMNGGGLSATNYVFTPAPGNATALTLQVSETAQEKQQEAINTAVSTTNQAVSQVQAGLAPSVAATPASVVDATTKSQPEFGPVNLELMSYEETKQLLESRKEFKRKLFADTIYKLTEDPSLADLRPCPSLADVDTGLCRMTDAQRKELTARRVQAQAAQAQTAPGRATPRKGGRKAKIATLPKIQRKYIVLFGIDEYADTSIPQLKNAVGDAEAVGKLFAEKLGYETRVVTNAKKADIVRALNRLSTEVDENDSVVIYYAGHGYLIGETGTGYWLAADANVNEPVTWISNQDISKILASIPANQVAVISDSCYSGAFTKEQKVDLSAMNVNADEVLGRRSVIVMSSGGDEPVADGGIGGHSIFAWNLMRTVGTVDKWQPGTNIFGEVQRKVRRRYPQTPQYGAMTSAGHQTGGDYLFEFRQLEETTGSAR